MFSIFRDFLATRFVAQFETLASALLSLTRSNTLVLPADDDTRETVVIETYGNALYAGPGGADVTLTGEATLFRLGGDGQVTVQTSDADTRVYGNNADNVYTGNNSRDILYGGTGADVMYGGNGDDVLFGGDGDDRLIVGAGRDRAYGGAGDDTLIAVGGQSRLYGGAGNDTFELDVTTDDLNIIFDFEAGDQLIIDGPGAFDSLADIAAAGGDIYQSRSNTIIKLGDAQIQLRDFALADLTDDMINVAKVSAPPEVQTEFDTIADFLTSEEVNILDAVTIGGTLYRLRDADPIHADYKFADADGRVWSQDYFVVVAAGQSNMVGSGVGGDMTLGANVAAYDWVNDQIVAAAYDAPPAGGAARIGSAIRNNLYFPFADQLSEDLDRPVLVISHAVSGSRIDTWLETRTAENWAVLNPEVATALAHVDQDKADAFIWHQGESDYPVPTAEYKAAALELVDQVRAQDWATDTLPFLFGELSRDGVNFAQNRAMQEIELENTDPNIGFVSSAGLISDETSGVHFNGESLNIFGARYNDVLQNLLGGIIAPANTAPEANPAADIITSLTIAEGQEIRLDMTDYFIDAENDELFYYAYLNKRNIFLARADQDTDEMVITPNYTHAGEYRLFIYANDFALDGAPIRINLTVEDAIPLVATYNNRAFDVLQNAYRDYDTGIAVAERNRGFEILDQAAFAGDTDRLLEVDVAHIRGDATIFAEFTLADGIAQSYYYGDAVFDVIGNAEDNYIVGADGSSTLSGGAGRDRLYGRGGDDTLFGGTGEDHLYGEDGDDLIDAGLGRDQAYGGAGADVFIFDAGDNQLYLRDFEAGIDVVQISGFAGISDYDSLVETAVLRDSNGRVIIDIGSDRIMFADTTAADLTADYFDFV